MTLLSDIESATEGSAELGARALNALSQTSDFGVLNGAVYFLIPPSPFSAMHQHVMRDLSSDITELWAECLRRGRFGITVRHQRGDGADEWFAYVPIAIDNARIGRSLHSPCLALLAALLRAEGVGDD